MFASEVRGLEFKSRVGQIGQSFANDSPPLQHFSKGVVVLLASVILRRWARQLLTRFGIMQRLYKERFDLNLLMAALGNFLFKL